MKKWIYGLGMGLCLLTACGGGANKEEAKENSQTATEAAKVADNQEGKIFRKNHLHVQGQWNR